MVDYKLFIITFPRWFVRFESRFIVLYFAFRRPVIIRRSIGLIVINSVTVGIQSVSSEAYQKLQSDQTSDKNKSSWKITYKHHAQSVYQTA